MAVTDFLEAAGRRVDARAIVTDAASIAPWLTDWRGRWTGTSAALLEPATTAEVAILVALAEEHGVGLVPQGGNSSMVGGATPPADGSALLLSLRRLNRIRHLAPDHVVAEAGVILQTLHEAAAEVNARFPLDLGARGSATLGGLAATNAGGVQVLRFGTMRAQVQGLEAVLAGGLVHDGLGGLKKDNRGVSLDHLLLGAEGTLGIITALRLRLLPADGGRVAAWVGLASPQAALALLGSVEASDRVEAFELIPASSVAHVLAYLPDARSPLADIHQWHVLIEAIERDGQEPAAVLLERMLGAALADGLIADASIAASNAQSAAFWRLRHAISDAEKAAGPAAQHDISLPVARVPGFLTEDARAIERAFPGTEASGFGHLGDGNVHFHVRAPARAPGDWADGEMGKAATRMVHDLVTAAGGSISAEHGIGQMKREELLRLSSPARMGALRAIKAAMDPHGIFNPGKLLI